MVIEVGKWVRNVAFTTHVIQGEVRRQKIFVLHLLDLSYNSHHCLTLLSVLMLRQIVSFTVPFQFLVPCSSLFRFWTDHRIHWNTFPSPISSRKFACVSARVCNCFPKKGQFLRLTLRINRSTIPVEFVCHVTTVSLETVSTSNVFIVCLRNDCHPPSHE
jgi:hypothetical protein